MNTFIAVAGNIGVGKTTFTKLLAETLGGSPYFEPVSENPYLADFYKNMGRWAFHSQLYFLGRRLKDQAAVAVRDGIVIQDRSLYEDADIFAKNLFLRGHISPRDWSVYQEIYQIASRLLRPPDLVVYLEASVPSLVRRIKARDRDFERSLDVAYLQDLNGMYGEWSRGFGLAPIVTVPTDDIRYLDDPREYGRVLELVRRGLGGLELPSPT